MLKYLKLIIYKWEFVISFLLLCSISIIHLWNVKIQHEEYQLLEYTPYTENIMIKGDSLLSILYVGIMPLVISIGVSTLFYKLNLKSKFKTLIYSSFVSFIMVTLPLLINFLGMFMILPNIKPDIVLKQFGGIFSDNPMIISLYYDYPTIFILSLIVFVGLWGIVTNVFSISLLLYFGEKVIVMFIPFILHTLFYAITEFMIVDIIVTPIHFLLISYGIYNSQFLPSLFCISIYLVLITYVYRLSSEEKVIKVGE